MAIVVVTLHETPENQAGDALTALSSICAAAVGVIAGWLIREYLGTRDE